ncbi:DJ-1 family glyoxalase III [Mangrovibacterium diazotrophicum]|uniref:4-methyl-5(B-hydroxyethyl)-thiazole monophosphate biosynthesis n=1 Tax=Mangrovibacterium diazotrophicum TaxID=1261403 RepID=A0A419VYD4_9BACT|nr:DJ-1 family glyoxalase III [Mangrovibacterium diazotrophicum]RKD88222.1 4-methyl-5(b-hydroxyethyl)-thiazole monophosphate biosynthesis [Mangrovibacterium diazotrophicum]
MKNIAVHLANGFEETEAITIIDLLRRAGLHVQTVSITGEELVTGSHEIAVKADVLFEEVDYNTIDMIILPGGLPGAKNLDVHNGLTRQIQAFHEQNKPLGAICAAPLVFGHLNILKGKKATCYPGFEKELAGANVDADAVVVDQNIITSRGVGTAIQFALKIVESLINKEKADQISKSILFSSPL